MARKPAPTLQPLVLEGDLDVFSVHEQWEKVQALLASGTGSAELDLSAVGDLDLSGLQLLCAVDRDLQAKGVPLKVVGAKAEWKTRFGPLGMAPLFDKGDA
jgi:ABC-type transporter Mla MlaB component